MTLTGLLDAALGDRPCAGSATLSASPI